MVYALTAEYLFTIKENKKTKKVKITNDTTASELRQKHRQQFGVTKTQTTMWSLSFLKHTFPMYVLNATMDCFPW